MLLQQPNKWSCLPTAFSMAIGIDLEKIYALIGHRGDEIVFPDLAEPYCRRSFHIQEMIDVCLVHDYMVTPIERTPISEAKGQTYAVPQNDKRMQFYITNYTGVLIGQGKAGTPHAVAWNGLEVLDPNGTSYKVWNFEINMFFLIAKFNITKS